MRFFPFYPLFILLYLIVTQGGISWKRIPIFVFFCFRYILFEPLRLLELIFYSYRISKHKPEHDPIFILGHWRSGTTHLQNTLSQDPAFTSLNIYRMLFSDHFLISEKWLLPILNKLIHVLRIPYSMHRSKLDLLLCAELDSALCSLGSTSAYTWGHLFPKKYKDWLTKNVFDVQQQEWITDYDYLIRKLSLHSANKRVVIKSPGDTARIKALLEKYPKASFIYIERNPEAVFHSSIYLWDCIQKDYAFQKITKEAIEVNVVWTYPLLMQKFKEDKVLIPKGQLIEIEFNDLLKDPGEVLMEIYDRLNLGTYPEEKLSSIMKNKEEFVPQSYNTSPELLEKLKSDWEL